MTITSRSPGNISLCDIEQAYICQKYLFVSAHSHLKRMRTVTKAFLKQRCDSVGAHLPTGEIRGPGCRWGRLSLTDLSPCAGSGSYYTGL